MLIDGQVIFGTYDEMMSVHVPSPPPGDCAQDRLITPAIADFFSILKDFALETDMDGDVGPFVRACTHLHNFMCSFLLAA